MSSIPGITTSNFAPVMKERYKNPVISHMLSKLKSNNRPNRTKLSSHVRAPHQRRLPKEL